MMKDKLYTLAIYIMDFFLTCFFCSLNEIFYFFRNRLELWNIVISPITFLGFFEIEVNDRK